MTRLLELILAVIPLAVIYWLARAAFFPALLITCCLFGYRKAIWPVAVVAFGWVVVGIYGGLNLAPSTGENGIALFAGILFAALSAGAAAIGRLLRIVVDHIIRRDGITDEPHSSPRP